jgi:hypothetical protein
MLNVKRKQCNYNPFCEAAAMPIISTCRHVRKRQPKTVVLEEARIVDVDFVAYGYACCNSDGFHYYSL